MTCVNILNRFIDRKWANVPVQLEIVQLIKLFEMILAIERWILSGFIASYIQIAMWNMRLIFNN